MKKFIVLYHAPAEAIAETSQMSAEDQARGMELWMEWAQKCGDHLVDMGAPLMNGQQISHGAATRSSDKEVSGYSVLQADSMAEAESLLDGHPHLGWNPGCSIEVHETMALPGM